MIYPKKLSSKKGDLIFKILLFGSVLLGIILFVINKLTTPNIPWATLTNAGIIYVWITVYYSIKKNTNIAGHVMIQAIAISLLMLFIDYKLGFEKWSLNISIPKSVTSIGQNAFYKVPHIYYSGSASGSPWGALAIN